MRHSRRHLPEGNLAYIIFTGNRLRLNVPACNPHYSDPRHRPPYLLRAFWTLFFCFPSPWRRRQPTKPVELARPGRPPADASSASRLISGALGIRGPRAKPSATTTRKGAASGSSKGGVRGRGASTALVQPTESTDSWDM